MPAKIRPKRGFSVPLSLPRRLVCDLLNFASRIPTVPVQRVIDVRQLRDLRSRADVKVGCVTLFTKAYARVAREMPELRQAYLACPRPRLYQHPYSVASVAVERSFLNENGVFFGDLPEPDQSSLIQLEARLRRFKLAPVSEVFGFTL